MRSVLVPVLLFLCFSDYRLGAAQETTGTLAGRVVLQDSLPLAEVEIVATSPRLLRSREVLTGFDGYFILPAMPAGIYSVTIRRVGFRPIRVEQVPVRLGGTTSLGEIHMQTQTVELPELVVSGERALLDPTSASINTVLPATTFETLPTDRSYLSIATLAPQTNASYIGDGINIAGATGLENAYYIDGVNVTDPYLGITGTSLPYNFVQEIQVRTGGYEAEYGRALGGIINVVTPSGGNDLEGQAFGFFTSSGLSGPRRQGLAAADLTGSSEYDAGVSLGGPIVRDRAWFFAAVSAARMSEDVQVPGFGTQDGYKRSNLFAGKLTWQPAARTTLILSLFGDPTTRRAFGPFTVALGTPKTLENIDPLLSTVPSGGSSVSLQARHLAGQRLHFEASLSRLNRHDGEVGATSIGLNEPLYIDNETGHWSGGFGHVQDWRSRRTAAKIAGTAFFAAHTIKAGVDYEDNQLDAVWQTTYPGVILAPTPTRTDWWGIYLDFSGEVHNKVITLFAQDSWLLAKWLRLNVGLRWDGQIPVGNADAPNITNRVQPRLGLVAHWGPQTLSASFARYQEQLGAGFTPYGGRFATYIFHEDPRSSTAPSDSLTSPPGPPGEAPRYFAPDVNEWTAKYTRLMGRAFRLSVALIHRDQGEVIDNGSPEPFTPSITGNPGRGELSFLPRFERRYTALELTFGGHLGQRAELYGSYVLSKSWGNYPGVYDSDNEAENSHSNLILDFPEQVPNSWGRLPNDRPHVFKLFGSSWVTRQLAVGMSGILQSGTPLNELGAIKQLPAFDIFLQPRGSAGRASVLWDLNARVTYVMAMPGGIAPRLVLDVFHIGSPRHEVTYYQVHYQDVDDSGNQILPNPTYLTPTRYQSPMSARLGVVADF